MTDLMRKITIPTLDTPDLSDLRYLVEHSRELGVPEYANVMLLRKVSASDSASYGPYGHGPRDGAMVVTWQEPAP